MSNGCVIPLLFSFCYHENADSGALDGVNQELRVAMCESLSLPYSPEHDFDTRKPLKKNEVAKLEFQFEPSGTYFRKGDELRLVVQGRYFLSGLIVNQPFAY